MNNKTQKKRKGSSLMTILISLVIVFVVVQLYVLTTVGTRGEEISSIRAEQATLKIETEIVRAQIHDLKSNSAISETIENLQMTPTSVKYIEQDILQISALSD